MFDHDNRLSFQMQLVIFCSAIHKSRQVSFVEKDMIGRFLVEASGILA